jgi:hypothetical protein
MEGTRKKGFALTIVISLLTIASSLIIGFALIANMENKKINNICHAPELIAKQNALHALNEALAKLQATTGQDTVATAKADMFTTTDPKNKYWVGVWKIDKCDEKNPTAQDKKTFLTWLVSGNYTQETDCTTTFVGKEYIPIINPKYGNIAPNYVELIDGVSSNSKGKYAYWIDDQSLKIQGNIYDSGNMYKDLFASTSRQSKHHWYVKKQCQGKYGITIIPNANECPLTQTFLNTYKHIQSEISYANLLNSSAISENQRRYLQNNFHDLTNLSLGLLTDTRNGGFRKNLRYKETNYLNEIPQGAFIFLPPTTLPAPPTTWDYLKSFFNINTDNLTPRATLPLYRPQSGVNYQNCELNCETTADGYTKGEITGTNKADLGIATQYGIYPIWVGFKNYIILYYYGDTTNNTSPQNTERYQSLRMQPGFHFENPYVYPLASSTIKIGQWSPYVANPENSDTTRYQKQPTFRCKIFYNDGESTDGLIQDYPENTNTTIFPFCGEHPTKYMRPVWEGIMTTDYTCNAAKYIMLHSHTPYITSGRTKQLKGNSSNDPRNGAVNDIRFHQPGLRKDEIASHCWIESYPSPNNNQWNGTWKNDTDQWTQLCLRSTDTEDNILQQISEIQMDYGSIETDRNFVCKNLSSQNNKFIPIYLTCVSLRKNHNTEPQWHPYKNKGASARPFAEANPCAPISCRTAHQDDLRSPSDANNFIPGNWSWHAHWIGLSDANSTTCNSPEHIPFDDYSAFRNILDLPEKTNKFFNLGFLQHMNVGCFSYHPIYAFGNSYQNPHIPRENFFQGNGAIPGATWPSHHRVEMLYDYSYCLNRTLWDSYFIASNNIGDGFCLLNPRQKAFTTATQNNILSFHNAAENIAIHGAFNVNSTSLNAWTAFLGSTTGTLTGDETQIEYSRIQTINSTTNVGMRQLTHQNIHELARNVVEQIKLRGIAGSIGEFVNRKLITKVADTNKLGLKGAIQAAIDATTQNDNYGLAHIASQRKKQWFDDEAATGWFWAGKPGYLTQADILQSIATPLCVRGDTFCIYTYGNALDKQGAILAEIRSETIVQRVPELLDPTKKELGRKYKILATKWIPRIQDN